MADDKIEVERLTRQIAELRAEYLNASKDAMELAGKLNAAVAENARLRALPLKDEVERVLEPFVKVADHYDGVGLTDDTFVSDSDLRIGHLRAARALLSRLRAGEPEGWRDMPSAPGDEETPVLLWINGQCAVGLTWKRRDGTVIGKASMFGNSIAEYWQPLPASPSVSEGGSRNG